MQTLGGVALFNTTHPWASQHQNQKPEEDERKWYGEETYFSLCVNLTPSCYSCLCDSLDSRTNSWYAFSLFSLFTLLSDFLYIGLGLLPKFFWSQNWILHVIKNSYGLFDNWQDISHWLPSNLKYFDFRKCLGFFLFWLIFYVSNCLWVFFFLLMSFEIFFLSHFTCHVLLFIGQTNSFFFIYFL